MNCGNLHYLWGLNVNKMDKKRAHTLVFCLMAAIFPSIAQENTNVFDFLRLPTSSHAIALGGRNISLIEDDISLAWQNPALLSSVNDKSAGVNFMTYMAGCKTGSAAYSQITGERGTWGVTSQFLSYGSMKETTPSGELLGTMSALDMCLSGMYSYALGEKWVGGAAGKFIYSHYGEYTSCALAVDLGLNYFDLKQDLSVSIAARNLGGQVKAFADHHERLPIDLELGFTKGMGYAPFKISATLIDLTHWSRDYYYSPNRKTPPGRVFFNHLNFGVDITPIKILYISGGYNFRRAYEMKAAGSSHAAGLTFGAGIQLKKCKFGVAYAKYHLGAPTLAFSLSYSFQKSNQ